MRQFIKYFILFVIVISACVKEELEAPDLSIQTIEVLNIERNSASGGGKIFTKGNAYAGDAGICWGTSSNPTYSGYSSYSYDTKTYSATNTVRGNFGSKITDLKPATKYYVRAYAQRNGSYMQYGNEVTFTTKANPTATFDGFCYIRTNEAQACSCKIDGVKANSYVETGICWDIYTAPKITDNYKNNTSTSYTNFSVQLTNLTSNTLYYTRLYCKYSSNDIVYGDEKSFTTLPIVTTNNASNITANSVTCGGYIESGGYETITERGLCYSSNISNPTINNSKKQIGSSYGSFSGTITGLSANRVYYVRAYATNDGGTSYGDVVQFTTTGSSIITIGGTSLSLAYLPIDPCMGYNYSQQLYTASEINKIGTITKIAYYRTNGTSLTKTGNIDIYMSNKNWSSYFSSTSDWVPISDLTLVKHITALESYFTGTGQWYEITLTTPFYYNGGDLTIAWDENEASYNCNGDAFCVFQTNLKQAIYYNHDNVNPDPSNPPSGAKGISDLKNSIKLTFQ